MKRTATILFLLLALLANAASTRLLVTFAKHYAPVAVGTRMFGGTVKTYWGEFHVAVIEFPLGKPDMNAIRHTKGVVAVEEDHKVSAK